ncbi:MAG: hypothetical protein ABJZ55_08025, partial [Fuerstiella sp.]
MRGTRWIRIELVGRTKRSAVPAFCQYADGARLPERRRFAPGSGLPYLKQNVMCMVRTYHITAA